MVWWWGEVKNSGAVELHTLMCSSRLREKERSVRRSRLGHHSVTHLVQCPHLRTMTAQSSETWGRRSGKQEEPLFQLLSSPLSFCLHPSSHPLFFWETRTKATREAVEREGGLQRICRVSGEKLFPPPPDVCRKKLCINPALGLRGKKQRSLLSCICRSSLLIVTEFLSLFSLNRMGVRGKTVTLWKGRPPSMAVSFGWVVNSLLCKHGLTQATWAPQHWAWGSQSAWPEVGTRKGQWQNKRSLQFASRRACSALPGFTGGQHQAWARSRRRWILFLHTHTHSVCTYIYTCVHT